MRQENAEIFRYIAHLREEDQRASRVDVELVGVQSGPAGNVEQRLSEHPEIRDMYLVAINEQIASALERRPFEILRVLSRDDERHSVEYRVTPVFCGPGGGCFRTTRANRKAYRDEAAGIR